MKKFSIKLIIFFLSVLSVAVFAQAPADPFPIDEEPIPIDGGISLLIGAGVLLGSGTLRKKLK